MPTINDYAMAPEAVPEVVTPPQPLSDFLTHLPQLPHGLQNIALSFSGGGFRAAAFSLGCFSYLEHIQFKGTKLSALVRFISSASGGSFASMAIVHAQRNGGTFNDAYRNLYKALDGDCLLKRVHQILTTNSIWKEDRPTKDRNFINGFAIAYDEKIFNGDSFGVLWNGAQPGTVSEICVNTTDFTHGQQFRFQHDGTTTYKGKFGSNYLLLKDEPADGNITEAERNKRKEARWAVVKKIKLGDILAASSCFPAGFEPIMYPNDFGWEDKTTGEKLDAAELLSITQSKDIFINKPAVSNAIKEEKPAYGFMDGGIVDNQGIDAFLRAEDRLKTKQCNLLEDALTAEAKNKIAANPALTAEEKKAIIAEYNQKKDLVSGYGYDLFAACDVSSNYTSAYDYPKQNKKNWLLKPSVLIYGILILVLLAFSITGIYLGVWPVASYLVAGALGFPIAIVLLVIIMGAVKKIVQGIFGKKKEAKKNTFNKLFGKHVWYFLNLPLSRVINLLMARAGSLINLALVLFLKKIRQDAYTALMSSTASGKDIGLLVSNAADKKLLNINDAPGWEQLLDNEKSWTHHTINPTVYKLSEKNKENLENELEKDCCCSKKRLVNYAGSNQLLFDVLLPGDAMKKVAGMGTGMPTTLWFDDAQAQENMRAALIAAGQFTVCHSLLRFVHRFNDNSPEWIALQNDLLRDWASFQTRPYWLYNQVGDEFKANGKPLENFRPIP